ncbi:hypothetical protein GX51_00345 [Blastomyces parvus]|uniref:Transcription factor domain-containing protein n=1 Tax=Blastomyces parvus TaxID=2060905 RepID=A0A2B7XN99_9EURO|nr:hypothetical protein GX51_00345 [Blastomyces parvus]
MDDMRFFHHYMIMAYPHLPDGTDTMWITEIPLLAHEYKFLMHALLSLGASHLCLVTMNGLAPEEMRNYSTMLSHRSLALRGLQQSMDKQAQATPLTASAMPNITRLNAMLATCYALTTQSCHLRDGFMDFVILIRGCARITSHIAALTGLDPYCLPRNVKEVSDPRKNFQPLGNGTSKGLNADPGNPIDIGIKMCDVKLLAESLRLMIPLLQHECHQDYHAALLETTEALQRGEWIDAFNSFQKTYVILCTIDEAAFQNYILPPLRAGGGAETEAEMGKNGMFLVLFIHLTALKVAMYPMFWRVLPERARFPQAIFQQGGWLIDISAQVPPVLHGYAVLPLEVIVRAGDEYGMFKSEPGERLREELIARAEKMRWNGLCYGKYMDIHM